MNKEFASLMMPALIHGRGSVDFFGTLGKKRVGVIRGGRSFPRTLEERIEAMAKQYGFQVRYLAQVRREPYIEDIFSCQDRVREFEPDLILAVGGGSVLDTAKAIHLFYENPELGFEQALIPYSLPRLGKKALHVSVPTTSGTGAEVTSAAVFIDAHTMVKRLLLDPGLIPHYAIWDAELTDSMSDELAAVTGLDALTHAIEATTAENGSALTRTLGITAALDILENLPDACAEGIDMQQKKTARERVHIAAGMAGICITNSCTGIAHSYDHPGAAFGLAHGRVCGLMLPYTMKYCGSQSSYGVIAGRLGYGGSPEKQAEALREHLFQMMEKLRIPTRFADYGIDRTEYDKCARSWAELSLAAFATQVSPARMTVEKGLRLYEECYQGMH